MDRLFQWLDNFRNANMVRAAFGEPYSEGGRTVIPVAQVAYGFGMSGPSPAGEGTEAAAAGKPMTGGYSRPLAVISISSGGVSVEEIVDSTKVVLSGMALGALAMVLTYRLLSRWLAGRQA